MKQATPVMSQLTAALHVLVGWSAILFGIIQIVVAARNTGTLPDPATSILQGAAFILAGLLAWGVGEIISTLADIRDQLATPNPSEPAT